MKLSRFIATTFTDLDIPLDGSSVRTYTGSVVGTAVLTSTAPVVAGVNIQIVFEAGDVTTGFTYPAEWNVDVVGWSFSSAVRNVFDLTVEDFGGTPRVTGVLRAVLAPDTVAPTVVTATGTVGDDQFVVVFDKPVAFDALPGGFTLLPWTVGTPKTLASLTTPHAGGTTVTFTLSAVLVAGDAFSLTYASSTLRSLWEVALVDGATVATVNSGASLPHEADIDYDFNAKLQSGTPSQWDDQSAAGNDGVLSGTHTDEGDFFDLGDDASSSVRPGTITAPQNEDYSFFMRLRRVSGYAWDPGFQNLVGSATNASAFSIYQSSGASGIVVSHDGSTTNTSVDLSGFAAGVTFDVAIAYTHSGTTMQIYVDDMSTPAFNGTVDAAAAASIQFDISSFNGGNGWRNQRGRDIFWRARALTSGEFETVQTAVDA